ncbi:hypothetical protein FOA52_001113 [Chlamydomonas sp. UWO 241]|nr:hypothetical protein FOA52_001113 [Chlamydomonas sp. UWO 241]
MVRTGVPATGEYDLLPFLSNIVAVHLAHIPGTNKYIYMESMPKYDGPQGEFGIAGTLDLDTGDWVKVEARSLIFCAGHVQMANGSMVVVGGWPADAGYPSGMKDIRVFTEGTTSLVDATPLEYNRWYPGATLLADGQILIYGGTQNAADIGGEPNPVYEIWDPTSDIVIQLPVNSDYLEAVQSNFYAMNYVLPDGLLFSWCKNIGFVMNPYTAEYLVRLPSRDGPTDPETECVSQHPYTGTGVMLMLDPADDYAVEVMVMGGQREGAAFDTVACSTSVRMRITSAGFTTGAPEGGYDFNGGWDWEQMGQARVLPIATLLPNGYVILLAGAQRGLGGYGGLTSFPALTAEMYDPSGAPGARWTTVARTQIARLYHSTCALTLDGTILVTGCDSCYQDVETNETLSLSPSGSGNEFRNEIFYPPFWFHPAKPAIVSVSEASIGFSQDFVVTYTNEMDSAADVSVVAATLVAPSSTTHSTNLNQRVVKLQIMEHDIGARRLVLRTPPSPNHAPPQLYMLFLINGDQAYSQAKWLKLDASIAPPADVPADVPDAPASGAPASGAPASDAADAPDAPASDAADAPDAPAADASDAADAPAADASDAAAADAPDAADA